MTQRKKKKKIADEFEPLENIDAINNRKAKTTENVILIFELPPNRYAAARPYFDKIIARHNLTCHVRIE